MSAGPQAIRQETYGENGASFVDRLRTWMVGHSIRRATAGRDSIVALDLGCGYRAGYLRALQGQLARGVGVDFRVSDDTKKVPGLEFVEESIEGALPKLAANQFDLVLFISVLEHVADPEAALHHCHRVLRHGGRLLVNVPTWWAKPILEFSAFTLGTSPAIEMEDHKLYYDKRTLWPMLVKAGFRPSRIRMSYQKLGMTLFSTSEKAA